MLQQDQSSDPFGAAFAAWQARRQDPAWVTDFRQASFAKFCELGLPTRRDEEWKYTSVRPLKERAYSLPEATLDISRDALDPYLAADDIAIVFVNGQLTTAFSTFATLPPGLTLTTLREALRTQEALLRPLLLRPGSQAQPFSRLNSAFLGDGVVVQLAANTQCSRRLHLLHVTTMAAEGTTFAPRHVLLLGEDSQLHVTETYVASSPAVRYFVNAYTDIQLAPSARLTHHRLQGESTEAVHVGRGHVDLASSAQMQSFCFSAGGKLARYDLDIVLQGEDAAVTLDGLYLARAGQLVDHHSTVDHRVPNASSKQLYKGILGGDSRAVFNGKVFVRRNAHGTNAQQMNRNLLLSSEAEIDTKPELQIDADDVKCAHGASIGQLDDDQLFYLRSRGLNREQSRRLLIQAFADEILGKALSAGSWPHRLTLGYFS